MKIRGAGKKLQGNGNCSDYPANGFKGTMYRLYFPGNIAFLSIVDRVRQH